VRATPPRVDGAQSLLASIDKARNGASFDERLLGRAAMWHLDSSRGFLDEHTSRRFGRAVGFES